MRDHEGGLWHSKIITKKFPHLRAGDIVYVKGAKCLYLKDTEQPQLQFAMKSNMLKFLEFSKEYKQLQAIFDRLDNERECLTTPMGQRAKFNSQPKPLKELFFNAEEQKQEVLATQFGLLGLKISDKPRLVDEIQDAVKIDLIVKDLADKTDTNAYILNVKEPENFFALNTQEMEDVSTSVKAKAKTMRNQPNSFVKGLVKREGSKYTLVNTKVM